MKTANDIKQILRPYHPHNWAALRRSIQEKNANHCHVLSANPPVVYLWWGRDDTSLHYALRQEKLIILYLFPWCTLENDIDQISQQIKIRLQEFPNHRIILLCNEEFTVSLFNKKDIEAIFCNQNCFIDERVFCIMSHVVKDYDAIYSAAMSPYKRHQLAAQLQSLMLLTYRYGGTYQKGYEAEVRSCLKNANWAKDSYTDSDKVTSEDIARLCNRAKVGLCLSQVEGAMFASMEYLLCGLPIVTTKSRGGRDVFFDPAYVEVVEDTPEAVAAGVATMISRAPEAEAVRAKVLEKVSEHRQSLTNYLKSELPDVQIPWQPGSHGPTTFMKFTDVVKEIKRNK